MGQRLLRAGAILGGALVLGAAAKSPPAKDPLVARGGGASLTLGQARALLDALPAADRARMMGNPQAVIGLLRDAMLQGELMAKAHATGFDKKPDVIAAAERARQNAIVRLYVASVVPAPAAPTDDQLRPLYEANQSRFLLPRQYHLAQIFLHLPATAGAADIEKARQRLMALQPQLTSPRAFAQAAKSTSDDTRSAAQGGDLGWIAENKLVDPIKSAVAGLQIGGVSDPLRTMDGFHLVQLLATMPAGPASFDQARPVLTQAYAQQQMQLATKAYLDGMLKASPIEVDAAGLRSLVGQGGGAAP